MKLYIKRDINNNNIISDIKNEWQFYNPQTGVVDTTGYEEAYETENRNEAQKYKTRDNDGILLLRYDETGTTPDTIIIERDQEEAQIEREAVQSNRAQKRLLHEIIILRGARRDAQELQADFTGYQILDDYVNEITNKIQTKQQQLQALRQSS
jgi:hypothetical protein